MVNAEPSSFAFCTTTTAAAAEEEEAPPSSDGSSPPPRSDDVDGCPSSSYIAEISGRISWHARTVTVHSLSREPGSPVIGAARSSSSISQPRRPPRPRRRRRWRWRWRASSWSMTATLGDDVPSWRIRKTLPPRRRRGEGRLRKPMIPRLNAVD